MLPAAVPVARGERRVRWVGAGEAVEQLRRVRIARVQVVESVAGHAGARLAGRRHFVLRGPQLGSCEKGRVCEAGGGVMPRGLGRLTASTVEVVVRWIGPYL